MSKEHIITIMSCQQQQLDRLTSLSCRMSRAQSLYLQGYGMEAEYLKARVAHDIHANICIQTNDDDDLDYLIPSGS